MVPGGSVTSLPSVAAIVPPPPIRTPSTAPLTPPRMPPMIAPTPEPAPILPDFSSDAFALERLRDRAAHRIVAAAHGNLIERYRQAALPIGARRLVNRADDAAHDGTGWNERRGCPSYRSTTVVASKRSSTCAVAELNSRSRRTSIS